MIHHAISAHPGLAAIAAVLASTATPAFAQVVTTDPSVMQAQPAAELSVPVSADPAATAPVTAVPSLPDLPVVAAEEPDQATAEPRQATAAPAKNAGRVRPKKPTLSMPAFTPAPPRVANEDSNSAVMPADAKLTAVPIVLPSKTSGGMARISDNRMTETVWLLLGGGLLVMAAAGTAFAISRRRKPATVSRAASPTMVRTPAPVPAAAPATPMRVDARTAGPGVQPALEALVAQQPSSANPFNTRRNRLRRAHYLLRTGKAHVDAPPQQAAARAAVGTPATDRWSEMRIAGQAPMWVNWQPAKR